MNYALPFCRGDIVGVYDAEDRPDPGQIRAVVQHLQSAPPEVACVQGYLDFYNSGDNWLARCFTLEYAIWFRVVLLGVQRLGLPIPLGGTSRVLPARRARAARRLGRAQRHRGRRPRDAARPLRLPLRDDPLDDLGGGELPGAPVDPPAVALAQGLRRHLGDAHAPAARALARPRARRLLRLPDAVSRRDHLVPGAAAVLGRAVAGARASGSRIWQGVPGWLVWRLRRLDARSGRR